MISRPDDLHGQLENDDVPGYASHARPQRSHNHGALHQRLINARLQ